MKVADHLRGVYVATLTPFDARFGVDVPRLAAHIRWLMASECDGACVFGTTGEGTSVGVSEKLDVVRRLVADGIPARALVLGTATASLDDTVRMVAGGLEAGVTASLVLPPFYFKAIDQNGLFRFYAELVERVGDNRARIYLYNLPGQSGVPLPYALIERLLARYPRVIAGIKDSSADWPNTEGMLKRFDDLAVLTGAEHHLPQAVAAGATGTICGMANMVPHLVRRLYAGTGDQAATVAAMEAAQAMISRHNFIHSMKSAVAQRLRDDAWRLAAPPLASLDPALDGTVAALADPRYGMESAAA